MNADGIMDSLQPIGGAAGALQGVRQETVAGTAGSIGDALQGIDEGEVAPGMTAEEVCAAYFDADALQEQPEPVYRLDSSGHRYYYTFGEDGEPSFYVSVTTLIRQTMPTSPQLVKWVADMGYDESLQFMEERAAYGTFMHMQIEELVINRSYNLDALKGKLRRFIEDEQLPCGFISHADELKKDVLAFAQFMKDYEFKPLAVELVLVNPVDGYAGAIDLCGEITVEEKGFFGEVYKTGANAGKPKETKQKRRVRVIIDCKSGRKGFYPDYEVQLAAYKEMWNIHFPQYPVERVYNWAPSDWRGAKPGYKFKDQTGSKEALKLPYLVELARIEDSKRGNTVVSCTGVIDLDRDSVEENVEELSLAEIVKRRKRGHDNAGSKISPAGGTEAATGGIVPVAGESAPEGKETGENSAEEEKQ